METVKKFKTKHPSGRVHVTSRIIEVVSTDSIIGAKPKETLLYIQTKRLVCRKTRQIEVSRQAYTVSTANTLISALQYALANLPYREEGYPY